MANRLVFHIVVFLGLAGCVAYPHSVSADDFAIGCQYAVKRAHNRLILTLSLHNTADVERIIEHPANRQALAFIVLNESGNVIAPSGVAKVDPRHQKLTIPAHGESEYRVEFSPAEAFPFVSGTGQYAYALEHARNYRLVVIYRPFGIKHEGYVCGRGEWREQILSLATPDTAPPR